MAIRFIHWIGYFTTVAALIIGAFAAYFIATDGVEIYERNEKIREATRTHEGPFAANDDDVIGQHVILMLAELPAINTMEGNGLRFVALPSFGNSQYAVAMWRKQNIGPASALLVAVNEDTNAITRYPFLVPAGDYIQLVEQIDALNDKWDGTDLIYLDGVTIVFERIRGKRVTSGVGNVGHYSQIGWLVLRTVMRFAPDGPLPSENDWQNFDEKET